MPFFGLPGNRHHFVIPNFDATTTRPWRFSSGKGIDQYDLMAARRSATVIRFHKRDFKRMRDPPILPSLLPTDLQL